MNFDTRMFMVQLMSVMSDMRRLEGEKSLDQEFADELGIATYTMTEDDKGKKFFVNNDTGEVQKVRKPRPRYLKVVK